MRRGWMVLALAFSATPSWAQVQPTNAVGDCTRNVDPTALRQCVESSRQSRPASTFDPSATAATGNGGSTAIDLLPRGRRAAAAKVPAEKAAGDAPADSNWRLRIP